MGGEPTLHPEFPAHSRNGAQSEMRVDLLSNATWPEVITTSSSAHLPAASSSCSTWIIPTVMPRISGRRYERNLAAIAGRGSVTLSFNIFEKPPRYEYILDLASKYNIDKVRLSFSLPVIGANNACLKLESYKELAPFVVEFATRAEEAGVQVRMDNAVPLCMFNYEQAGELLMKGVVDLQRNMRCGPVIDIGPDLRVWCCFCLSKMWNRHLDEFQNLSEIQDYYRRAMSLYQSRLYPMEKCNECTYRELWNCQGGCLTHTVLRHGELSLDDRPAGPACDGFKEDSKLAFAPTVEIRHYDLPEEVYALLDKATGLELEVDGSFRSILDSLDGQSSGHEIVDRYIGRIDDQRHRQKRVGRSDRRPCAKERMTCSQAWCITAW